MYIDQDGDFEKIWTDLAQYLMMAPEVWVGEVQSTKLPQLDSFTTHEIQNVMLQYPVAGSLGWLQDCFRRRANLEWAEAQFLERVSGVPYNPPPSHRHWPYAEMSNARFINEGKFDHTYPERFWPKRPENIIWVAEDSQMRGIRFPYGDLNDVALMLCRNEMTRQAYLPIFFPEDTGATQGQRIPCTLGYHFLYREGSLNMTYFIRSCDFWKHFADDLYMACRLCQWMVAQIQDADPELAISPGFVNMHTTSMHLFKADVPKLKEAL